MQTVTEQPTVPATVPLGVLMPVGEDHGAFWEALHEEERRVKATAFLERMEAANRQRGETA